MKRLLFLLAIVALSANAGKAQTPNYFVDIMPHVCSNIEITLYAVDQGTCNVIGQTNPIVFTPGSHTDLAPYIGIWAIDPSVTCPTCVWEFHWADVKSVCLGTGSGTPTCGTWDMCTPGMPNCGYNHDECFNYSTSCNSCLAGDMRHAHFDVANMFVD
jgi:hypothetical protein